jgi:MFS family permease
VSDRGAPSVDEPTTAARSSVARIRARLDPYLDERKFLALYFTRFVNSFGFVTLLTLLPEYINLLDPSPLYVGLFTSGLTIAQTAAVVPISWGGDRYDKRTILLGSLLLAMVVYAGFALVTSGPGFVTVRALQGVALTGVGVLSLALVGELAPPEDRAHYIGKANSWRFAASILGSISAAIMYAVAGFNVIFGTLVALLGLGFLTVWRFVPRDDTRNHGFPFSNLALNRRLLTITGFRAQYAVAVTLVRTWVPIYAGVEATRGGLDFYAAASGAIAVSIVLSAEKFTNMLSQPTMGRLSDRFGRAVFVAAGGTCYGLVAIVVPFTPEIGSALGLPETYPILGHLSAAFVPLVVVNGLLGLADSLREPASMALFADEGTDEGGVASSFGMRSLVWRPGSVLAPMLGGYLMAGIGMAWVFYVGAATAFTGVLTFVAILWYAHGTDALTEW